MIEEGVIPPGIRVESSVTIEIPFHDIDILQVAWHGHYLKYFEVARTELMKKLNMDWPQLKELGVAMPIVGVNIEYRASLVYGKTYAVFARVEPSESPEMRIDYEIRESTVKPRDSTDVKPRDSTDVKPRDSNAVKSSERPKVLCRGQTRQVYVDAQSHQAFLSLPNWLIEMIQSGARKACLAVFVSLMAWFVAAVVTPAVAFAQDSLQAQVFQKYRGTQSFHVKMAQTKSSELLLRPKKSLVEASFDGKRFFWKSDGNLLLDFELKKDGSLQASQDQMGGLLGYPQAQHAVRSLRNLFTLAPELENNFAFQDSSGAQVLPEKPQKLRRLILTPKDPQSPFRSITLVFASDLSLKGMQFLTSHDLTDFQVLELKSGRSSLSAK